MIPVLFKKNEQQFRSYGLGPIHDIISPKVTRERNGQYLLYFQYPQDAEFADVFEEDMRIKSDAGVRTKWQTFEITRVVRKEGQLIEVFAKHISQSLLKDALNPSVSVRSLNAEQALRIWNNNRIGDEEFDVWSDISTTSSTNWDIRDVSNAFEALAGVQGSILDVWGGEYEFDNKLIRLHKEMGRKSPVPLEYGRNITGLEQDQQEDNVYTSVYPFATYTAEGDNQPKTVTLSERYIDGKYLEFHNKRKIQVVDFSGEFESDDIPTVSRLRTLTENYLNANEIGLPHENLKVEYIDLSKTLDYQEFQTMEEVELNDRLPIFYPKFGITNENAKVVVINYDPVKEENISIELGVIGQSFRTVTTGGLGSRLDRVEKQQDATNNYIVNAKGNRIWFETPNEDMEHKIGDTWFEENGPYDRIRVWNGNQWEVIIDSEDIDKNAKAIAAQQQAIEEAKQTADEAVGQINTAVANAGFTSLDETISSVQTISNQAQINSGTAINNALEAMQQASQAIDNTGSLNIRVDEVEGTLSVKADKQMVDDLTGVVDSQALDIQANAQGLALKANQSTVDMLTGTVQSLGTNFDIVAGQVNSRVWNTDIETAIDDIEVGGRNLILNSYSLGMTGSDSRNGRSTFEEGVHIITPTNNGNVYNIGVRPSIELVKGQEYTLSFDVLTNAAIGVYWYANTAGRVYTGGRIPDTKGQWIKHEFTYTQTRDSFTGGFLFGFHNLIAGSEVKYRNLKLEKGNIATDWTPAPEDTDAKIDYIETEWTQTFDSFSQTVAGIDGRVTSQKQTIDSISSTVSAHGGRISTVEQTASGLQTTVASKASQTQVTQLANGLSSVVKDLDDLEIGGRNLYLDSGRKITSSAYSIATYNFASKPIAGEKYTLSIKGKINPENHTGFYTNIFDGSAYPMMTIVGPEDLGSDGVYRKTFTMPHLADYISTSLYSYPLGTYVEASVEWIKIEKGNKATDWTPAPEDTQSQISQLANNINLRVTKGELLSQINIEAGRTLIQSDKILLNASNTVITGTTWMDGAVLKNLSVDGAKMADATISSAKISNLDVSKIGGNTSNFVQSNWNSYAGGNVRITGEGILTTAPDMSQVQIANGMMYVRNSAGNNLGQIGRIQYAGDPVTHYVRIRTSWGTNFAITQVYNRNQDYVDTLWSTINDSGQATVTINARLRMNHENIYLGDAINNASGYIGRVGNTLRIVGPQGGSSNSVAIYGGHGNGEIKVGYSLRTYYDGSISNNMWATLNMNSASIVNQSDERLKTNIIGDEVNSLEAIKRWRMAGFNWLDPEASRERQFGVIAQSAPEVAFENQDGYLNVNSSKQLQMTTHAVQQLALMEENTNRVASQALQLVESIKSEIDELREENRDLRNRIEELESAV